MKRIILNEKIEIRKYFDIPIFLLKIITIPKKTFFISSPDRNSRMKLRKERNHHK